MKISLSWLNDYVDVSDLSAAQVAQAFTDVGLEIEGVKSQASIAPEVLVGKVLVAEKHPNADSLRVTKVDVGQGEPLDIVCGAPNARAGIHVAVATAGAVLPGDFKIKKSKIRGETSNGMLCSHEELGLPAALGTEGGIIELKEPAGGFKLGMGVGKFLGLEDTVLEVNVTPNRGDCLGYLGLARDLAAKLGRPLKMPLAVNAHRPQRSKDLASEGSVAIKIADADLCTRFVALAVDGVSAAASPAWLQKRLEASGMRPLNAIVDATNYVMLEYGQPIHAYDERDIRGQVIEVRPARAGEKLKTLDGQERALEEGDILICDAQGPIGLAGIMGGENSEVKADTRKVIIEVAAFLPQRVRRTARRLGLHTEASHRFERGIDVQALGDVALRVAEVMHQALTEAKAPAPRIAYDQIDARPVAGAPRAVALRLSHAQQFLALPKLTKDDAKGILTALGFELLDSTAEGRMVFRVPSWRNDIEREADLVEEIGRLTGFDKIPYTMPVMSIRPTPEDPFIAFQENARRALAVAGLHEAVSFPFVATADLAAMGLEPGHPLHPTLTLKNPMSAESPYLRASLLPNLLRAAAGNRRRGDQGARLFELGRGWFDFAQKPLDTAKYGNWKGLTKPGRHLGMKAKTDQQRPNERSWIAAVLDQPFTAKGWNVPEQRTGFFHAKALVQTLTQAFAIGGVMFQKPVASDVPFLHPGASAAVYAGGKMIGYAGELHPRTADALGLGANDAPVVVELDLEELFNLAGRGLKVDSEFKKFPPVTRDLAMLADRGVTDEGVLQALNKFNKKKVLTSSALFDVFDQEGKLPPGKKSLAYAFSFQSQERTLTDAEVEQEMDALVAWLGESLGAQRR
jgi:phenylalanyl-tRNA synthetase beta chain